MLKRIKSFINQQPNNNQNGDYIDTSVVDGKNVSRSKDNTSITITMTDKMYDYIILNAETDEAETAWLNGAGGTVIFRGLDPKVIHAVRVRKTINQKPKDLHQIVISPSIPLFGAKVIQATSSFNSNTGCGRIIVEAIPNLAYALLNESLKPLSLQEMRYWNVKVRNEKGYLLPRDNDGYYFGINNKQVIFEVPAGGEFKLGYKLQKQNLTFVDGNVFTTINLYHNAWYEYVLPLNGNNYYRYVVNPACPSTEYSLTLDSGNKLVQKQITGKNDNKLFFSYINPQLSYTIVPKAISLPVE